MSDTSDINIPFEELHIIPDSPIPSGNYDVESIYPPTDEPKTTTLTLTLPSGYKPDPLWHTLSPDAAAQILTAMARVMNIAAATTNPTAYVTKAETKDMEHAAYNRGRADATSIIATTISDMKTQNARLEEMNAQLAAKILALIEKAFGKTGTAKEKGEIGESIVETWLAERFPDLAVTTISTTPHAMDILVEFADGIRVLIEVKNKDRLDKKDVDKFEADVNTNEAKADAAILLSLRTKTIPMRGQFQMATLGKMTVVYMADELSMGGRGLALVMNMLHAALGRDAQIDVETINELATQALHSQREITTRMAKMQKLTKALAAEQDACATPIATVLANLEKMAPNAVAKKHGNKGKRSGDEEKET